MVTRRKARPSGMRYRMTSGSTSRRRYSWTTVSQCCEAQRNMACRCWSRLRARTRRDRLSTALNFAASKRWGICCRRRPTSVGGRPSGRAIAATARAPMWGGLLQSQWSAAGAASYRANGRPLGRPPTTTLRKSLSLPAPRAAGSWFTAAGSATPGPAALVRGFPRPSFRFDDFR